MADGEEKSRFIERIIEAQEDERRRISRELHDEIGQGLTSLLFGLRSLETSLEGNPTALRLTDDLHSVASSVLEEVGRLARGLRPTALDDLGLHSALERYVADFSSTHRISTDLQVAGITGDRRLPASTEITLYRVVQEGLTNIAKHARAGNACVVLEHRGDHVRLVVEDNGRGMARAGRESTGRPGLGLLGVRERVGLLNGSLTIESSDQSGTSLFVTIPTDNTIQRFAVDYRGRAIVLPSGSYTIGRSSACDIALDGSQASRRHARITVSDRSATIEDMGSTNGVYLNGTRITAPEQLRDGDRVVVGGEELGVSESTRPPGNRRASKTVETDPSPDRREDPDSELPTAQRDALAIVGRMADDLLDSGMGQDAEHVLSGHLEAIREGAATGSLSPDLAMRAAQYALKLASATGKRRWLDFVKAMYQAAHINVPKDVAEDISELELRPP